MNNVFYNKLFLKKNIILFLFFLLVFFTIYNQKKIQKKVSTFFLEKVISHFGKKVSIKHASINLFKKELILHDVKIKDHHHFSFIHLSKCRISIPNLFYFIFINSKHLKIKNLIIENYSSFFIKKYLKEKDYNIIFLIKNILNNKKSNKMDVNFITCSKLIINKSHLVCKNINYLFYSQINNIFINKKQIKASIQSKGFFIKKNFFIKNFFCNITYYYTTKLKINNFLIKTSHSYIKGYFTIYNKKNIQGKIFEGSKLGSDFGIFFYKKWSFLFFIQGRINGELNDENKKFFISDIFIKDLQGNKLFADKIHIFYIKKKWKEIKFYKIFIKFNPYKIRKIIPYNFYSKFRFITNIKQWIIYKGSLIFKNQKKNIKIEGIIQNNFFKAKIATFFYFLKKIQYTGKILIKKKYLDFLLQKNFFLIPSKISLLTSKNPDLWIFFKGNLETFFITLFFYHSKYKISLKGKISTHFQIKKISLYIDNINNKILKIILINNQHFKKIYINVYNMIIGNIHGYFKWKHLFYVIKEIFFLKNYCSKQIISINFSFLIKKSFFDLIKSKKDKNIFSDIHISGKKENNILKILFFIKAIQFNEIFVDTACIIFNYSLKKNIQINAEKIFIKNFFLKKINIFLLKRKNFWMINSKFFFKKKEKKQEFQEQILNFLCKEKNNFFIFYPLFSKLNINEYDWIIDNVGTIKIDFINKKYIIDNIILYSGKQKIIINAFFFKNKKKIFQLYLNNVPLKKIIFKKNVNGLINGFIFYKKIENQIEPNIHIKIENFSIEENILGNFYIHSFHKNKNYEIYGVLKNNIHDILNISGNINNQLKNKSKLNFKINITNLRMDNFSFLWKKMNSEARGILTGRIQIFGDLDHTHYFGKLEIKKFGIKVNSTNTDYEIISPAYINVVSESCILSPTSFIETKSNTKGSINGSFLHKNFFKWHFKLFIYTKNLLVLNTNKKQNHFLFGKIFTHGKIKITKKENNKVDVSMIDGQILNYSHLYVNPKASELMMEKEKSVQKENNFLFLNIKTSINNNTKISIFLDKNLENFIELRGKGYFFLKKTYKKNIQTSGKFFIINGLYHFYIKKIPILKLKFKKEFKIKPGGFISWKENFYQSNINFIAYDTKEVSNVIEYMNISKNFKFYKNFIFTELKMTFNGRIQKPNINVEISFPKSNEEIQKKLLNKLNSFKEKTIQFVSILILGKFYTKNNIIKNFLYFSIYGMILKEIRNILLNVN
ncbi:translocation/assembly module TamB domain-containing protein [Blattabacterium cuenoti]|uniref:translocation/assembly module TamB domain-containing protein n=1 Tax=Blattabacterium cuenoti TaxID=1653831 RepID=UPI00163B6E63|nr:translocation/assembly module TamB domain-containing protein [Blattabacterium cuenoti]